MGNVKKTCVGLRIGTLLNNLIPAGHHHTGLFQKSEWR
jgi:hypothetical protein